MIVELGDKNFGPKGMPKFSGPALILFHAPWCKFCVKFKPTYAKIAASIGGVVRVGAVNVDENPGVIKALGVDRFPTLKSYNNGKWVPYEGARDYNSLMKFVCAQMSSGKPEACKAF